MKQTKTYDAYPFLANLVKKALSSSDITEIEGILQSLCNAIGWDESHNYETACYDAHDDVENHVWAIETHETK